MSKTDKKIVFHRKLDINGSISFLESIFSCLKIWANVLNVEKKLPQIDFTSYFRYILFLAFWIVDCFWLSNCDRKHSFSWKIVNIHSICWRVYISWVGNNWNISCLRCARLSLWCQPDFHEKPTPTFAQLGSRMSQKFKKQSYFQFKLPKNPVPIENRSVPIIPIILCVKQIVL